MVDVRAAAVGERRAGVDAGRVDGERAQQCVDPLCAARRDGPRRRVLGLPRDEAVDERAQGLELGRAEERAAADRHADRGQP
jgi:hypothetical protein